MRARVQSFAPVIGKRPRVLILGSMPGIASLEAVQYYAHPRNVFWPIMADLFSLDADTDYAQRIAQISEAPVILWDTLKRCDRPGSLDASIRRDSVEANDIAGLLVEYPGIRAVACNGATSANYFRKLVVPELPAAIEIELLAMPSTSPANAGMNLAQKLAAWRRLLDYID
ncbi:MAG TPA: DNA-deoxyinosine glycosylase [Gammaproteobacteria bacterium]|nr:DNA-deoxyinosine glycosylase [Gammaproteobacteria bacterium]